MSSLTGKIINNNHNLRGNSIIKESKVINDKIKTQIVDYLILPILNEDWVTLNNNSFQINLLKNKINKSSSKDRVMYTNILDMIQIILNEHNQLSDLEKKTYTSDKEISSIVYKTKMIRLKAEYEIYNLIFGAPNETEIYDNLKLDTIRKLLLKENITFEKIKNTVFE